MSIFNKTYAFWALEKFTLLLFALFLGCFILSDKSDTVTVMHLYHTPKLMHATIFLLLCSLSYFFIGKSTLKNILYACLWTVCFLSFAGHYQIGDPGYYDAFVYNDLNRSVGSEYFSISLFHGLLHFFGFHLEGITIALSFLGGVYIFFIQKVLYKKDSDRFTSMLNFFIFASAGMTLTFFRDGEVYSLVTLFGMMLIYFLHRNKNVSLMTSILFAVTIALHYLALVFMPLYLLKLKGSKRKIINFCIFILSYLIIDHFFRYTNVFGGLPVVGGSSLVNFFGSDFSLKTYLWERSNMLFFTCPGFIAGFICLFSCSKNKEKISLFSYILLYAFLIFLLFFDFVYSVYGDYNLYVLSGLGILFFLSECVSKGFNTIKLKTLKAVVSLLIIFSVLINFQIISYRANRGDTDWDNIKRSNVKKETKGDGLIHSDKLIGFINRKSVAKLNLKHEANELWYTFLRTFFTRQGMQTAEEKKNI